jgi:hypothetical protein
VIGKRKERVACARIGKIAIGTRAAAKTKGPYKSLSNKRRLIMTVAIITGRRGLGPSTALQLRGARHRVILTYNSHPEGADEVVRAIEASAQRF